jgi:hypothetical protein
MDEAGRGKARAGLALQDWGNFREAVRVFPPFPVWGREDSLADA